MFFVVSTRHSFTLLLKITRLCERVVPIPTFGSCRAERVDLAIWPQGLRQPEMELIEALHYAGHSD